jgi:hypothetical protein
MREHATVKGQDARRTSTKTHARYHTLPEERNMIRTAYNRALDDPRFAPMKEAILVKDGRLTEEGIRRGIKL